MQTCNPYKPLPFSYSCINSMSAQDEVVERELSKELAGECLSLLCKTSTGLSLAYVRLDLKNRYMQEL